MADELMIYLEDCLDGSEYIPGSISASQVKDLVSFGVKFDAQSHFWSVVNHAIEENIKDMTT